MHTDSLPPPNGITPPPVPPPLPTPGVAIGALATATGAHRFDVALGLAAVLGAVAGPLAGPKTTIGDLVNPSFHLLAAANHSGSWHRLEELLLQPVAACQKRLRDWSGSTTTARLDHLQYSHTKDHTDAIVEAAKPQMFSDPVIPAPPVYPEQHVAAFRTPTFFLRAPDNLTWTRAQPEILNSVAFVWDGGAIFDCLCAAGPKNETAVVAKKLVAAAVGNDRFVDRGKQVCPGYIDSVKACLFVSTSRDAVAAALSSVDPDVQRLLQRCVFGLPSRDPQPIRYKPEYVRAGYEGYCAAVEKVLSTRRNGSGFRVAFKAELSEQVEQSAAGNRNWCAGLPPRLQPHFARITSLPHQLAWACLATLCPGEKDNWVAPFVRATVKHVLTQQKEFLEEQMLAAEVANLQRAREIMLAKLARSAPCFWRELVRHYSIQRGDLHQPVLDALMNEGMVRRRDDGRLELTGATLTKA